jgi:RHS repeat-associated protein
MIDYDSFGARYVRLDSLGFEIPLGFAGGLYDPETRLCRFGYRDYDTDTGRWTAKDPILFSGGDTNLYRYCVNDPVNWVDPDGTFAIIPVIGTILAGATVIGIVEFLNSYHHDKILYDMLESHRKFLQDQRGRLNMLCFNDSNYEKFLEQDQFYKEAIERVELQETKLGLGSASKLIKVFYDLGTGSVSPKHF